MKIRSSSAGALLGFAVSILLAQAASAAVIGQEIVADDTYVEVYAPRTGEDGSPQGFFVERHYNFAQRRLIERYYGEQSIQVVVTPFSEFDGAGGANYILDDIKPEACKRAGEQKAEVFMKRHCTSTPAAPDVAPISPPATAKPPAGEAEPKLP